MRAHPPSPAPASAGSRAQRGPLAAPIASASWLAVLIAGCADPVQDIPGTVPPGSIADVEARTHACRVADQEALPSLRLVPRAGAASPTIPLIHPPTVITFYVFPRPSRDGLAMRSGVWISRVLAPFSWGVADAMQGAPDAMTALGGYRLDDAGRLRHAPVDAPDPLPCDPQGGSGADPAAGRLPWRAGESQVPQVPMTRTTILFDGAHAVSTVQPLGQAPPLTQPGGAVNIGAVQKALQDAAQRAGWMSSPSATGSSAAHAADGAPPP